MSYRETAIGGKSLEWCPRFRESIVIEKTAMEVLFFLAFERKVVRFDQSELLLRLIDAIDGRRTLNEIIQALAEDAVEVGRMIGALMNENLLSEARMPARRLQIDARYERQVGFFQDLCPK